jgi:hypothetical protein
MSVGRNTRMQLLLLVPNDFICFTAVNSAEPLVNRAFMNERLIDTRRIMHLFIHITPNNSAWACDIHSKAYAGDNIKKKCKYCIDRSQKDVREERKELLLLSARSVYVFLCVERRASAPWPCNMPCFAHCRLTTCSPRDVTAHQQQSHNPQSGPSLLSRTRSQSHQGCRKTRPKIAEADSPPPLLVHCLRSRCVSMRPFAPHPLSSILNLTYIDLCFHSRKPRTGIIFSQQCRN